MLEAQQRMGCLPSQAFNERLLMKSIHTFTIALMGMFPLSAHAFLVTDFTAIPSVAPTIDFSQFFSIGRIVLNAGDPPIEIDTLTSETVLLRPVSAAMTSAALLLGQNTPPAHADNGYYLGANGYWGPGRLGFLGVGGGNGSRAVARIEFTSGPVSFVGGLFNYPPNFPQFLPVVMSALDSNLSVIEQHSIDVEAPISTTFQTDVGAFRGIAHDQPDIFAVEISAPFAVMDDIRFSRTVVPEPGTVSGIAVTISIISLSYRAKRRFACRPN